MILILPPFLFFFYAVVATTTSNIIGEVIYTGGDSAVLQQLKDLGLNDTNVPIVATRENATEPVSGTLYGSDARNSPNSDQSVLAPSVLYWKGDVTFDPNTDNYTLVPPGQYKIRIKGLRHFTRERSGSSDADYDIIESPSFSVLY